MPERVSKARDRELCTSDTLSSCKEKGFMVLYAICLKRREKRVKNEGMQ